MVKLPNPTDSDPGEANDDETGRRQRRRREVDEDGAAGLRVANRQRRNGLRAVADAVTDGAAAERLHFDRDVAHDLGQQPRREAGAGEGGPEQGVRHGCSREKSRHTYRRSLRQT